MHREFINLFGRYTNSKPAFLWEAYGHTINRWCSCSFYNRRKTSRQKSSKAVGDGRSRFNLRFKNPKWWPAWKVHCILGRMQTLPSRFSWNCCRWAPTWCCGQWWSAYSSRSYLKRQVHIWSSMWEMSWGYTNPMYSMAQVRNICGIQVHVYVYGIMY